MMQCTFTDNYDSSFCFWVFEKRLTQKNCFLFCKKYGLFNSSIFLNNQQILTVLLSKLSWSALRGGGGWGDKILVFHTRSRVVSASSGSRPGHKVSGTRSKFLNLNENGQKSHFLLRFFRLGTRSTFCLDPPSSAMERVRSKNVYTNSFTRNEF